MGVILDSSILIAGERARESVAEVLERVEAVCGKTAAALSAVTAVELTHGICRARNRPQPGQESPPTLIQSRHQDEAFLKGLPLLRSAYQPKARR
jgi:predicted nucleic acid-binding protein